MEKYEMKLHLGSLVAFTLFAHTVVAIADSPTTYLSHPPIRQNPAPSMRPLAKGPGLYVDAAKGDDAGDGSSAQPWNSVNHALKQLKAGDTLYLRGGSYFENVYVSLSGTKDKPIVIRSYPGEQAVIDGGLAEFQLAPADAWQPFAGGGVGEFRSTKAYPNIRDVVGAFGDSDVGLQTYWHLIDLRSPHELSAPGEGEDVRPQYCGPGIFYDRQTGHIHVRLAYTHFKHFENYAGQSDPRKLPLVISPFRSTPLWVDQSQHVKFQDLIIRGGGYETTRVTYGVDVDFDNVTIRGGTYCMHTENTGPFRFYRSAMYGNTPPWSFRGDGSLRARPGRNLRDLARLTCHALWVTDTGREFSVYAFPLNDDWEVAYSEFTDSHDGLYLGGISVKFHHNLVDFFQDDGIYLSQMYPRHLYMGGGARIEIYENLFTRSLTPLAFGGAEDTRDDIYIYRNVFDLRGGVNYGRPSDKDPDVRPSPANRAMSDHGGPPWPKMTIYHNTFVTLGGSSDLGTMGHLTPGNPRAVFNNLFFNFTGLGGVQPPAHALGQADGNLYWSPNGEKAAATFFNRYRNSPAYEQSKAVYPPGFTTNSLAADPRLVKVEADPTVANDYRLQPGSAAINAGVAINADWPDSRRGQDAGKPDMGALPLGAKPFVVGRSAKE
jgi:hypothetical protein